MAAFTKGSLSPAGCGSRSRTQSLEKRYGAAYFHGETSGYPPEGYQSGCPDWNPWLDFIKLIHPSGVLVDLGCAYGYLPHEAARRGYRTFGLDVSSYALGREPSLRERLVRADVQALPLAGCCADIVTLFDVLEHLEDPLGCLSEATRILRADGLILGATPDPVFFDRMEETHCFERPPSFWVRALKDRGLEVRFRFSGDPFNFQFAAARSGSPTADRLQLLQHDRFSEEPDFLSAEPPLLAVLRQGWRPVSRGARSIAARRASLYLLNLEDHPLALRLSCSAKTSPDFAVLRILLDSLVLDEIHLGSEKTEHAIEPAPFLLPGGGHHLFFDLSPEGPQVLVRDIRIQVEPGSSRQLVLGLPYDLYQRYRLAAEIISIVGSREVLDIGGYIGDEGGHLALPRDFLVSEGEGGPRVQTTDLRACDHPDHTPATAWEQPFPDAGFDLVLSLDVLEHLPPEHRPAFLAEMDRVARRWILLGAPFSTIEVEETEKELAETLLGSRRFLLEHRELGLPDPSLVTDFFEGRGYRLFALPNGSLSRWKEMQVQTQHYYGFRSARISWTFNRLANETLYPLDQVQPAYRTLYLISKQPLAEDQKRSLAGLISENPGPDSAALLLSKRREFLELHRRIEELLERRERSLLDVHYLTNERHKLIELLRQERETQLASLAEHGRYIEKLEGDLWNTPLWRLGARRLRKKLRK